MERRIVASRAIERASYDSVAFRFVAGNTHPDHDTIATFRRRFAGEVKALFVQVLLIARTNGLLNLVCLVYNMKQMHRMQGI